MLRTYLLIISILNAPMLLADNTRQQESVLIKNVTIVSPEREQPVHNIDVLIMGKLIKRVEQNIEVENTKLIDGTNLYLTPGLIDSHTHLGEIPGMSFPQTQKHPQIAREARQQAPLSYLYHGVTTVIDLNSDHNNIQQWNSQALRPTAYFCGGAPVIDGYPMHIVPKPIRYRLYRYFLLGDQPAPAGVDAAQHTPAAVARRIKQDGGICVKTHYESGFGGGDDWPVPTQTLIRQLVEAARLQQLPVFLHANSQQAYAFGVTAGVDAFAHGMWTWSDVNQTQLQIQHRQLLDKAIKQDIAMQATIQVLYGERDLHDPNYLKQLELAKVVPNSLLKWYASSEGQQFRQRMSQRSYVATFLKQGHWHKIDEFAIRRVDAVLNYWANNSGRLLFGSDTPSDLTFANPHGLNSRLELSRWAAAGVTPERIFKAATLDNAVFFGLDAQIGSIQPGKHADLLLMTANPLDSVDAYDTIHTVIVGGQAMTRQSLAASE